MALHFVMYAFLLALYVTVQFACNHLIGYLRVQCNSDQFGLVESAILRAIFFLGTSAVVTVLIWHGIADTLIRVKRSLDEARGEDQKEQKRPKGSTNRGKR